MTEPDTIRKALEGIEHVDHLVMLAGTFVVGKALEADIEYLEKAFDERVWASLHVLRVLGARLAADGSVTFVSGVLADRPNAHGTAVLGAACSAMESLARGLTLELAPRRVNTVSPGSIDTPLLVRGLGDGHAAYVASVKEKLPQKRIGAADDVAAAVVFLLSNPYMTGETLHVDGGARLV